MYFKLFNAQCSFDLKDVYDISGTNSNFWYFRGLISSPSSFSLSLFLRFWVVRVRWGWGSIDGVTGNPN